MEFIDDNTIIEYFKNDASMNFIASCISPWHALGVESAIIRLCDNGISLKGIILVNSHNGNYVVDESCFSNHTKSMCIISKYKRGTSVKLNSVIKYLIQGHENQATNKRKIFFVGNTAPNVHISELLCHNLDSNIVSIISDEGIGSYTLDETFSIKWALAERKNKSLVNKSFFVLKELFFFHIVYKVIMSWPENRYETIFLKKNQDLLRNDVVIESYRVVLERAAIPLKGQFDYYSNSIVIATQPYVEDNMCSLNEYMTVICSVISYYKRNNKNIILRIHPRENDEKYLNLGCRIEKSKNSLESIIASLSIKPEAIIAFNSTVLVTANLFWEIKSISLGKMMIDTSTSLPEANKENITRFLTIFRDYIILPDDYEG